MNRERDRGQDKEDNNEEEYDGIQGCDQERDRELNRSRDRELQRAIGYQKNGDKDKDQTLKKLNGTDFSDRDGRELSSESCDDDLDEVENQLGISNQQLEELQKQISQMEELAKEKRQLVITFQEKAQKLEVALTAAKKLSSHRQMQLTKLHRCFLHVKDYNERLKSSEQELQSLVGETMTEDDTRNNVGGRDLTNGNT